MATATGILISTAMLIKILSVSVNIIKKQVNKQFESINLNQ